MMKVKIVLFFFLLIASSKSTSQTECGTNKILRRITIGGNSTIRGEHPWKVALIDDNGQYFCGGSLISIKAVVIAAQCIKNKGESQVLKPEDISVVLGAQDLSKAFEKGRITVGVKSIQVHPDWNIDSDSYDGDIALLTLDVDIQLSATIQPICLSKPQPLVTQEIEGFVVGFQKVEGPNNAKKLKVQIKDYHNCVKDNDNLKSYLSARTICGGSDNANDDFEASSGSGLYVFHDNRAYLRGITSASSLNKKLYSVETYGIFADTAEYCGWIQSGGINKYAQCKENDFTATPQPPVTLSQLDTSSAITTTTEKPIKHTLNGGECLYANEFIQSPNKCFKVFYQGDGNFVNYRASSMQHTWHSKLMEPAQSMHACK
ncbi:hypothetical protein ACKWTF_003783 [Chironomus riparius]